MRGEYGKALIGYLPRDPKVDDRTPYGRVRPVGEMGWSDQAAVLLLIAIGGAVVYGAKRAGDYAKDRYEKRLSGERIPRARVLNGAHK